MTKFENDILKLDSELCHINDSPIIMKTFHYYAEKERIHKIKVNDFLAEATHYRCKVINGIEIGKARFGFRNLTVKVQKYFFKNLDVTVDVYTTKKHQFEEKIRTKELKKAKLEGMYTMCRSILDTLTNVSECENRGKFGEIRQNLSIINTMIFYLNLKHITIAQAEYMGNIYKQEWNSADALFDAIKPFATKLLIKKV